MRQILRYSIFVERVERTADGDALIDLTQRRILELLVKLWLADEHQLQKFFRPFEIGEDAYFLEQLRGKVLRLVEDQDRICLEGTSDFRKS